jgi:hypothetical protein
MLRNLHTKRVMVKVMMLNTTFNNISVISWRSVLLMEETGVPGENYLHVASPWQTLSHNVLSSTLTGAGFEITTLVVIGADCICSCKSNYHTITTTKVPSNNVLSQLLFEVDKIMGIQKEVGKILSSNTKDNWIIIRKKPTHGMFKMMQWNVMLLDILCSKKYLDVTLGNSVYTRAVRKVRGQVPIFLKNNVFFKNVSDTCIP